MIDPAPLAEFSLEGFFGPRSCRDWKIQQLNLSKHPWFSTALYRRSAMFDNPGRVNGCGQLACRRPS